MPGRPAWSQPGTQGGGQTIATQQRPEVEEINVDQTGIVEGNSTEETKIYAPEGSVYTVKHARIYIRNDPDWSSSHDGHKLQIRTIGTRQALNAESNYSTRIQFQYGSWKGVDNANPNDPNLAYAKLTNLRATPESPITLTYSNLGDTVQEEDRKYSFICEVSSY